MARPWTREEMVLTLDHYIHKPNQLGKNDPDVRALADVLGRTPDSVSIRFMNYRARDPKEAQRGVAGMRGGGEHVDAIWSEFREKPLELRRLALTIYTFLSAGQRPGEGFEFSEDFDPEVSFPEGRVAWVLHKRRERDPRLVREAKKRFRSKHGNLHCEACGFDFQETYGEAGKDFIEVHHNRPVSEIEDSELTSVHELSLLCANCHRVLHRRRPWLSVADLRACLGRCD